LKTKYIWGAQKFIKTLFWKTFQLLHKKFYFPVDFQPTPPIIQFNLIFLKFQNFEKSEMLHMVFREIQVYGTIPQLLGVC
jgi:hypothetical protein